MKNTVFGRILFWYLVISAILGTVLLFFGAYFFEGYLTHILGHQYYAESMRIAEDDYFSQQPTFQQAEMVERALEFVMGYQQCRVWITDPDGRLLFPEDHQVSESYSPEDILHLYNEMISVEDEYIIGEFSDVLKGTWLSVIAPVREDNIITEYVVFHYPMARIYHYRRVFQRVLLVILFLIVLFGLIPLFIYQTKIKNPIFEIKKGAEKYAEGNLDYQIPLSGESDLGYVACSLNYMADHLRENNRYHLRFLADLSHDFRSPLTSIKGYANAMLEGVIPPDQYPKYLDLISYESDRLVKLTHNLTTLNDLNANRHNLRIETFDINEAVLQTLRFFEGTARQAKVQLQSLFENERLMVKGDNDKIQQVLYNLTENAIKFSAPGSEVLIQTYQKNGKAFISVKDHGKGIPKEDLSRIWDRFFKGDLSRGKDPKGTGLGLTIVKEIITAHEEKIDVISTEGVGTEFLFTLPISE